MTAIKGRPAHQRDARTAAEVERLSGLGLPQADIATVMQLALNTLKKYYGPELDRGLPTSCGVVAQSLFRQAKRGNITAAIWWEKTRAGRSEKQALELSGADGGPLVVELIHRYVNTPPAAEGADRSPGPAPEPATGS